MPTKYNTNDVAVDAARGVEQGTAMLGREVDEPIIYRSRWIMLFCTSNNRTWWNFLLRQTAFFPLLHTNA
jgi:hypothetical protein